MAIQQDGSRGTPGNLSTATRIYLAAVMDGGNTPEGVHEAISKTHRRLAETTGAQFPTPTLPEVRRLCGTLVARGLLRIRYELSDKGRDLLDRSDKPISEAEDFFRPEDAE